MPEIPPTGRAPLADATSDDGDRASFRPRPWVGRAGRLLIPPLRIGGIFLLASLLWIFLTDLAVYALVHDPAAQRTVQTLKGWAYVALATLLVVYLARREAASAEREIGSLAESERRFRRAVEEAPFPAMLHAEDGEVLALSSAWVEQSGYSAEDIPTVRAWVELAYPEAERAGVLEGIRQARNADGRRHEGEYRIGTRGGEVLVWDFSTVPLGALPDGRRLTLSMAADVTGRVEREAELRISRDTYQAFFWNSHAVMLVVHPEDGRILGANPAAERFYGYSRSQLQAMRISDINTADPRLLAHRLEEVRLQQVQFFQFQHRLSDGSTRDVEVYSGPVPMGDEKVLLSIVHDVSDRAAARRELEHAQRLEVVGRLAGGIAHDFNNLVAVVLSSAELVGQELPDDHPARPDLDQILAAGERASQLTRRLLTFSRKHLDLPRAFAVDAHLRELGPLLRRLLQGEVELVEDFAAGDALVSMDPGQFEQVVLNLAVNARDAMNGPGRITIRTRLAEHPPPGGPGDDDAEAAPGRVREHGWVELVVEDDGPGIPADLRGRIFEPFFTTKDSSRGTGLGLSTVQGIVQQAEGVIRHDSRYTAGARFLIHLPHLPAAGSGAATAGVAPGESALAGAGVGPGSPRAAAGGDGLDPAGREPRAILLVDDEPALRRVLARIMERAGYTVVTLASGTEAVERAAEPGFVASLALVISDVMMPDLDGPAMLEALRARGCTAQVLFTSGYSPSDEPRIARDLGNHEFLVKPFTPAELLGKVAAMVGPPGPPRSAA
ncbi:MAG: PAS domain S-box protein [Longimicrobiales bacterium]|nr:PAS domain S-box protein [Longimicrobiales bacterium]